MGSQVLVVVANIVMEDLAPSMSLVPTVFWKRYVDDVLSVVPADQVDEMLAHINSIDHNIQFTLEREGQVSSSLYIAVARPFVWLVNKKLSIATQPCQLQFTSNHSKLYMAV